MDQFSAAVSVLLESQFSQDAKAQAIAYVNEVSSSDDHHLLVLRDTLLATRLSTTHATAGQMQATVRLLLVAKEIA